MNTFTAGWLRGCPVNSRSELTTICVLLLLASTAFAQKRMAGITTEYRHNSHADVIVSRLLQMHASERTELKEVRAGDIAAAVGMKDVITGDTLCDEGKPIILINLSSARAEGADFPSTLLQLAEVTR